MARTPAVVRAERSREHQAELRSIRSMRSPETLQPATLRAEAAWGGLPVASVDPPVSSPWEPTGSWIVRLDPASLDRALTIEVDGRLRLRADTVENVLLLLVMSIVPPTT